MNQVFHPSAAHSPPEREKTTSQLLMRYQQNGGETVPPSYLDTDDKFTVNVGVASSNKHGNEHYFLTSYENTISAEKPEPPAISMPHVIHQ